MRDRPERIVPAGVLRDLMEHLLIAAGCDRGTAAVTAEVFLEADLRGHSIQGLDHMGITLRDLRKGKIKGNAMPCLMRETDASTLVDGRSGLGQVAATFAADVAIRKAREAGCCAAGIFDAGDVFMLGYYTDRIARAGLVGIMFTNSFPTRVHPIGGIEPVLGTNPLSIAVPSAGAHPVLVDLATSSIAVGLARMAEYHGEEIPEGVAMDAEGRPTRDAAAAMAGALAPLGGHKGFGLGLCVALLSGPLIGAAIGAALKGPDREAPGPAGNRGHLIIAIDTAAFGDVDAFHAAVAAYVVEIKGSRKAPGVAAIQIPGESAYAERERRLCDGVAIYEAVWTNTVRLAADLGVAMPE